MSKFKLNQTVFSRKLKDHVQITNGVSSEDDFSDFVPTEGICLRVVGFNEGSPVIAYTYVHVDVSDISESNYKLELPPIDSKNYIGRV